MKKIEITKTVTTEVEVTPCFQCGADEAKFGPLNFNIGVCIKLYHVYCFSCGCTGPAVPTEELAVKGWNILYNNLTNEPDFDIEPPKLEYHRYI